MKRFGIVAVLASFALLAAHCAKQNTSAATSNNQPKAGDTSGDMVKMQPQARKGGDIPDPAKTDPAKTDPAKPDPVKPDVVKADPDKKPPATDGAKPAAAQQITGQGYTLTIDAPGDAAVNGQAVAKIVVKPADGYHFNKDFPTSLKVTPPDGVDVPKAEQAAADAKKLDETEATFEVAFTPKAAGAKQFNATFKFAVCTATTCDPKREKLAWNVNVK